MNTPSNYKRARNQKILKLVDERKLSLREVARRLKISVSIVHRVYWCEKLRSGDTKDAPKRVREQFAYLIK